MHNTISQDSEVEKGKQFEANYSCVPRRVFFAHLISHAIRINKAINSRKKLLEERESTSMDYFKIEAQDIPNMSHNETSFDSMKIFKRNLQEVQKKDGDEVTPKKITKALFKTFKVDFLKVFFMYLAQQITLFGITFIFQFLIQNLVQENYTVAYLLAALFSLALFIDSILVAHTGLDSRILGSKIKYCLISTLFSKMFTLSQNTITKKQTGKIINMLSNDFNYFEMGFTCIFPILLFPLAIAGYIAIFAVRLGLESLIMIGFIVLSFPINMLISKTISPIVRNANIHKDNRIQVTEQLTNSINYIKMNGWEDKFQEKISEARQKEFGFLVKLSGIRAFNESFSSSFIVLGMFFSFLAVHNRGGLTLAIIISCLQLINYLRDFLVMSSDGFDVIGQFRVTLERFSDFYNTENIQMIDLQRKEKRNNLAEKQKSLESCQNFLENELKRDFEEYDLDSKDPQTVFNNFSGFWNQEEESVIKNIDLNIKTGLFYGLTGPVGCGKTTLFNAFLGELPYKKGIFSNNRTISYLEQEIILFAGTIKNNIVNSMQFNQEKYDRITQSCSLLVDFQSFPSRDETIIGENGVTLSGGQRARVGLARALYKEADLYIFDDPFSALDNKVAQHIHKNVFGKYLKHKTVILSTHHSEFLLNCDIVILMKCGQIRQIKQEEIKNSLKIKNKQKRYEIRDQNEEIVERKQLSQNEEVTNKISVKMFFRYALLSQKILFFSVVLLFISAECCMAAVIRLVSLYDIQLNNETGLSEQMFWGLGFIFIAGFFVFKTLSNFLMFLNFLLSSNKIHKQMLYKVCRARPRFFDTTSSGQVFNKFSNDIGVLDTSFIFVLRYCLEGAALTVVSLANVVEINLYFLIVLAIFLFILVILFHFLQPMILQSKRIDLQAKTPIYSQLSEITQGISQIKMFVTQSKYLQKVNTYVTESMKANVFYWMSAKLLSIVTNYVLVSIVTVSSLAGIALINQPNKYAITILFIESVMLQIHWSLINMVLLKSLFESTVRCLNLTQIEQQKPFYLQNDSKLGESSQSLSIVFKNFSMRYRPELPVTLKNIDFKARVGQKVGFVGRSGAGKSSIIASLLRMYESEEGSVYTFDGHDALQMGLHTLRQQISVVPQNPVFMKGSVKKNIVGFDMIEDNEVWKVLELVNMKDKISSLPQGLETQISNNFSDLSVGQKQLFSLARALARNKKVIILDEPTSHIDNETINTIQNILNTQLHDKLVIKIAHKLETVKNFDKIYVMEEGRVKEKGSPYKLLELGGQFYEMVKKSPQAKSIREAAKRRHQQRKNQKE